VLEVEALATLLAKMPSEYECFEHLKPQSALDAKEQDAREAIQVKAEKLRRRLQDAVPNAMKQNAVSGCHPNRPTALELTNYLQLIP